MVRDPQRAAQPLSVDGAPEESTPAPSERGGWRALLARGRWLRTPLLAFLVTRIGIAAIAYVSVSVLPPADKQQVAEVLEQDAQIMSNTALQQQLSGQPQAIQDEIVRVNTEARHIALQVALLVPIIAGLLGLANSFRMMRLPDPKPAEGAEEMVLG